MQTYQTCKCKLDLKRPPHLRQDGRKAPGRGQTTGEAACGSVNQQERRGTVQGPARSCPFPPLLPQDRGIRFGCPHTKRREPPCSTLRTSHAVQASNPCCRRTLHR